MTIKLMVRPITPFKQNLEINEDALRQNLSSLADSKIGLYLASGGNGETYAMTLDEIRRLYEIGASECKGRVAVYGNPPEQHTAEMVLVHSNLAYEAGCEAVNIYPPASWHGYRPTEEEQRNFWDTLMRQIKYPVILAANPVVGYVPSVQAIADAINKYPQIIGLNINSDERYLINVKDRLTRDIEIFFPLLGSINGFLCGATGMISHEGNVIPKSFREFLDCWERRDFGPRMGMLNAGLLRYKQLVERWYPGNARPTKMVMRILKLPGGDGPLRPPNMMPGEDQLKLLAAGLLKVGLPEIDDLARKAGLI